MDEPFVEEEVFAGPTALGNGALTPNPSPIRMGEGGTAPKKRALSIGMGEGGRIGMGEEGAALMHYFWEELERAGMLEAAGLGEIREGCRSLLCLRSSGCVGPDNRRADRLIARIQRDKCLGL